MIINAMCNLLTSFFIYKKATNYSPMTMHKILTVFWCAAWACIYASATPFIPVLILRPLYCLISIPFVWKMTKAKLDIVVSSFLLSYGIAHSLLYVSMFLIGLIFAPFLGAGHNAELRVEFNEPIYLLFYSLVALLQFLLAYLFFKIKRFKLGFPFLAGRYAVVIALVTAGVVLIFVSMLTSQEYYDNAALLLLIAGVLVIGVGVYIWIRRGITLSYKLKMAERKIMQLKDELDDVRCRNRQLQEINDGMLVANHKIIHRLEALGKAGLELSGEYHMDIDRIKAEKPLPSTGIESLDRLFAHFSEQFIENEIGFRLEVSGSVPVMAGHSIPKGKLETMVGDHLQDALIAVSAGGSSSHGVLALIGKAGDCFEFSVHDSGVPFSVDTLVRLGTERVTTHAGGSGIGFMTTFETMRECGASLIISENPPGGAGYSKSVTIRFDGENRYIIDTYRPGDFPPCDRYIVK
jgi:signal transduction histidine kinase